MKKINFIYLFALLTGLLLWRLSENMQRETLVFYGFAENKETEINAEYPVEVKKLFVTTGQKVRAGTILAETSQAELPQKSLNAEMRIAEAEAEKIGRAAEIRAAITEAKIKKMRDLAEVENKIAAAESEVNRNKALLQDLGVKVESGGVVDAKIAALRSEKELIERAFAIKKKNLKRELSLVNLPSDAEIKRLQNESDYFAGQTKNFKITAPSDGLIGNIHVKEAEFVRSFNTLITFYEENPTSVQGFVHESMILKVAVGDSLEVVSSLHPEAKTQGVVTGLGSRIVEIPSRLRKMPEIKTYGREILIQIPADNSFLQKEKVILRLRESAESRGLFGSLLMSTGFLPGKSSRE